MRYLKPIVPLSLLIALLIGSCSPYSTCDKWRMSATRGETPFVPGTDKTLDSKKGSLACVITLQSKVDRPLNIYIDSVWQGLLEPKAKGYVNIDDGDFEYMHAISVDGDYAWAGKGNCRERNSFKITD